MWSDDEDPPESATLLKGREQHADFYGLPETDIVRDQPV